MSHWGPGLSPPCSYRRETVSCARSVCQGPPGQPRVARPDGWRKGEGCGPGSQPPGGHCWQPEQRPLCGLRAGAGNGRRGGHPLGARRPEAALGAGHLGPACPPPARGPQGLPGNGCPGPCSLGHTGLTLHQPWPQASPSLQGAPTLRCPLPGLRAAPLPGAPGQGSGPCQRQRHLGPGTSPFPALGRSSAGVHGTSPAPHPQSCSLPGQLAGPAPDPGDGSHPPMTRRPLGTVPSGSIRPF